MPQHTNIVKPDQAGGEGVASSPSAGVRAAVTAAKPTIEANREEITKLQETALTRRKKRKKIVVKPNNESTVERGISNVATQGSQLSDLIELGKGKPR